MQLTNNLGLPDVLFRAIQNDKYSKGGADYSISELINPPRMTILKQRYDDQIVEDISDKIWTLLGKAVHYILEQAREINTLSEERLFAEIKERLASGQFDRFYANGKIMDFKFTSAWTVVYGSRIKEWTPQLNSYAYLLRSIGFEVNELEIVAIYKDWNVPDALQHWDYPLYESQTIPLELWSFEEQKQFLEERIELLKENENLPDDKLTPCNPEEMWESPTTYAVMKQGRKSAVRVFDSEEKAQELLDEKGKGHSIEIRPGTRTRCLGKEVRGRQIIYCPVREFCSQFKEYRQTNQINGDQPC